MTSNSPNEPPGPSVSSPLGRKWLEASDCFPPPDGVPAERKPTVVASGKAAPGTVFVEIPDVASSIGDAFTASDFAKMNDPEELASALSQASQERLGKVNESAPPDSTTIAADEESSLALLNDEIETALSEPLRNDLAEPPKEWTDKPATKEAPRTGSEKSTKKQSSQNLAIDKLVNAIVERFPIGDPTVLMFVGSEPNRHTDETCARVASVLAERRLGRILLLDSDSESHSLSNASGVADQPGITDIINYAVDWESTIYGRSATGLDFLGAGTGVFHHEEAMDRLRHVVADMKRHYQFVCISAGQAHSSAARIWSEICDGSYLLVSVKNSNQTIAKSAVTELQSSGARLLGCVVTDVD